VIQANRSIKAAAAVPEMAPVTNPVQELGLQSGLELDFNGAKSKNFDIQLTREDCFE
jgi:hypothetical protein